MGAGRQAFLFACHELSPPTVGEYAKIRRATEDLGDAYLLFDRGSGQLPEQVKQHNHYLFSLQSISQLGYPLIDDAILPGNNHYPLLQFFAQHGEFERYWVIEYDVRFSGDWRTFLESFSDVTVDFLSCHIRSYSDEPRWQWWSLHHLEKTIELSDRLRSFNPIYRISREALRFLDSAYRDGWWGHHEVSMATLLHHHGFSLMDFGGKGRCTATGSVNLFYTSSRNLCRGTMRYRPAFFRCGRRKNTLYHPVKPSVQVG